MVLRRRLLHKRCVHLKPMPLLLIRGIIRESILSSQQLQIQDDCVGHCTEKRLSYYWALLYKGRVKATACTLINTFQPHFEALIRDYTTSFAFSFVARRNAIKGCQSYWTLLFIILLTYGLNSKVVI
jgi:hypothetical protein